MTTHVIRASNSHRRRIQQAAAAAGNGLLNSLIAYWPGDEASGNLIDAHTNGLDLTDNNTVTNNPGVVYSTARQYTRANSKCHTRPGDDALLSTGDVDFTFAQWLYMDSKPASSMYSITKWNTDPDNGYIIGWHQAGDRMKLYVSDDGIAAQSVAANNHGSPSLTTWMLLICSHDAVNNQLTIQVNNGVTDSQAHATGVYDSTARFAISVLLYVTANYWDGRIGPTAFWKSAAGGGGVLSAAARTALWNGGAGLKYSELTT